MKKEEKALKDLTITIVTSSELNSIQESECGAIRPSLQRREDFSSIEEGEEEKKEVRLQLSKIRMDSNLHAVRHKAEEDSQDTTTHLQPSHSFGTSTLHIKTQARPSSDAPY